MQGADIVHAVKSVIVWRGQPRLDHETGTIDADRSAMVAAVRQRCKVPALQRTMVGETLKMLAVRVKKDPIP